MTYYLGYTPRDKQNTRGFVMFDIEYYKKQNAKNKEEWYSEISCLPCVDGITMFLKDKFNEPGFDYEQFIKDAYEIQEVRGLSGMVKIIVQSHLKMQIIFTTIFLVKSLKNYLMTSQRNMDYGLIEIKI